MDFPIEITLRRPVIHDGKTYETLIFDEPDLGTEIAMTEARTSAEESVLLLAGMAGVSRAVIMKVKHGDFLAIYECVMKPYEAHIAAQSGGAGGNVIAAS